MTSKTTISRRIKSIRARMRKTRTANLLLTSPANVTYTTGFLGADSWALITATQTYLLTDSRYTEQARKECPSCRIAERVESLAHLVADILNKSKHPRRLSVEASTSIAQFENLDKQVKAKLKIAPAIVEHIRRTKDSDEIATIKAAASRSARALKDALKHIKTAITESELAGILDLEIRRLDATVSFDTIVAFGPNASRPHHQPSNRKLKPRDTILIDFGARYKGYCSDITRCFIHGKPTPIYEQAFETVERAQAAAIALVKDGVKVTEIDAAARKVIAESPLPVYGHGTGHGFGLQIHETPFMKPDTDEILKAGDVITVEPGIYLPGKLGVRIEDDLLVTDTGCKILTKACPHSPKLPR